jgi:molecular chaperone HscA
MVLATRAALAADGALLSSDERATLHSLVDDTERLALGTDANAVESAVEALAAGTEAFAAARMNQGIRQALTGRSLDQV